MKAIIVDDEPKAIELLKSYILHFSAVELVATFRNGLKAIEYISKETVDLIFLDINMPHISGLTVSKMIGPETRIVFTTAYSEYAVESYEVNAIDYLLKPISLDRFSKTMSKILTIGERIDEQIETVILIKSGHKTHRVQINDILYLEKDGNYMTYHLSEKKILARQTVSESLAHLPANFIQTHKSFIINTHKISSIDKETVDLKGVQIPLGPTYKHQVLEHLFKNKSAN